MTDHASCSPLAQLQIVRQSAGLTTASDQVQRLEVFDYGICIFGLIGALLMLGVFGNVPTLLLFLWGLFSIGICTLSVITLIVSFTGYLPAAARRPYYLYICFNLVPSFAWVFELLGKTQIPI